MIKKYFIKTFWCAMNQADSEKINMILLQSWFFKVNKWENSDLIIFNTCSIRQKAEDRVFWFIEEIYKKNKKIKIWITGCMVRKTGLDSKHLKSKIRDKSNTKKINLLKNNNSIFNFDDKLFPRNNGKIDFVLRIEEIKYMPFILTQIFKQNIWNEHKFDDYLKQKQYRENKSQAIIIIQTGCDNNCSFCIVPQTRWSENSRTIQDIVNEAKDVIKDWAKEIILVWQNVNSYWKQFIDKKYWNKEKSKWNNWLWKSPFRQLLEQLNKIKWLDRIRFTSSNPHDMTKDILDAHFELDKMCNYLHFALQSWNDTMLKKMNRKHNYLNFLKIVKYLRLKDEDFSISTDIIVWFSWETEKMFKDTVNAFKECEFDFTYNARYSIRKWTIAAKMYPDDINNKIKSKRWHILNDLLLESINKRNTKMIWKIYEVLISWKKDWKLFWRTRNFKEIYFEDKNNIKIGNLIKVKIKNIDKYRINWELIN